MHYYNFNIGDYRKDTAHLSPIEHYIYRSLIDWCYLDECEIPKKTQVVMRRLGLGSQEEPSLNNVLSDFFTETENGWVQRRILREIDAYHAKAEKNRENGKKGGRPKKQQVTESEKPNKTQSVNFANPNESELNPNQEPRTNNQEPITKNQCISPIPPKGEKVDFILPSEVNQQAWAEFEAHRKEIRKPLTDLARTKAAKILSPLSHVDQQATVDKSIQSRWSGLFPDKVNGKKKQSLDEWKKETEDFLDDDIGRTYDHGVNYGN